MAIHILIRMGNDAPVSVWGGTPLMLHVVGPLNDRMETEHPDVHGVAFSSLEWSDTLDWSELDGRSLAIILDTSEAIFSDLNVADLNVDEASKDAIAEKWREYLDVLRGDPRLSELR